MSTGERVLVVTGEGHVSAPYDIVVLNCTVSETDEHSLQDVIRNQAVKVQAFTNRLRGYGDKSITKASHKLKYFMSYYYTTFCIAFAYFH